MSLNKLFNFLNVLFYATYIFLAYTYYRDKIKPHFDNTQAKTNVIPNIVFEDTTKATPISKTQDLDDAPKSTIRIVLNPEKLAIDSAKIIKIVSLFRNGNPEYKDSKTVNETYGKIVGEMASIMYEKFTSKQLNCINRIHLIYWDDLNYDIAGNTSSIINGNSYINIAVANDDYITTLMHEIWHAIHHKYYTHFSDVYSKEWNKIDDFVSDYSKTSFDEDVAETGCYYVLGDTLDGNLKFKIIKDFYNYTK